MGNGDSVEIAVQKSLLISLDGLEKRWRSSLVRKTLWLSYISDNLYEMLFLLSAIIAICGFFLILRRKRAYRDEEESDP